MTNAKVKVTKEVAEAIENLRKVLTDEVILKKASEWNPWVVGADESVYGALRVLREVESLTLAGALLNGYEIVEPPEKQVAEYYKTSKAYEKCCEYRRGKAEAIEFVAKAYGLKIEGVNV